MQRKKQIEQLMEHFQVLKRRMLSGAAKHLQEGSITSSQWLALRQIGQNEGATLKEIAQALAMSSSAATQLVEALVEKGYVTKNANADDRRELKLSLSESSKKHMEALRKKRVEEMEAYFSALTDEEFDEYCRIHAKLAQKLAAKGQ